MKSPLPKNRLVALTLLGGLLTAVAAVALAAPAILPGDSGTSTAALAAGAPTPNADFQPAEKVVTSSHHDDDDDRYEHEGYGRYREYDDD